MKFIIVLVLVLVWWLIGWFIYQNGLDWGVEKILIPEVKRWTWDITIGEAEVWETDETKVINDYFSINVWEEWEELYLGQNYPLTITAMDESYSWTVLVFSETDEDAVFFNMATDNTYTFWWNSGGTVTLENGVTFSKAGIQDIHIYSMSEEDSFSWIINVEVLDR